MNNMEVVTHIPDISSGQLLSPADYTSKNGKGLVKPYNVVDLSTHHILSDEEICQCLKDALEKKLMKKRGDYYGYHKNHAKPNGDAPNFISLPPKQRSKSFDSVHTSHWAQSNGYSTHDDVVDDGYDDVYYRERANTAPANYLLVRSDSLSVVPGTVIVKASRLALSPASPGTAKRKIQQKLQRDGKQIASPRMSAAGRGSPSPLLKHYSGSRIPGGPKAAILAPASATEQIKKTEHKESQLSFKKQEVKSNTPDSKVKSSSRIGHPNYRANLSRLSNKNSDAGSECSSDSGSCRSTPVYGSRSPLDSSKKSDSPPIGTNSALSQIKPGMGASLKAKASLSFNKKRSEENLPIRRENTFDNAEQRKDSSPSMTNHRKASCDDILKSKKALSGSTNTLEKSHNIKPSSYSTPMSRKKQSSESLPGTLDETSLSLKQRYESSSSIASSSRRSSIESNASDSSDVSRVSKQERYSKLPNSEQKKSRMGIPKKTNAESVVPAPATPSKVKPPSSKLTFNASSRIKQPTPTPKKTENASACAPDGLSSPPSVTTTQEDEVSVDPPVELETAHTKPNTQVKPNSLIRPSASMFSSEKKKKKLESPLTHRNKLTYSNNTKTTEQALQKDSSVNHSEQSKLRQPGTSSLSPAIVRSSKFSPLPSPKMNPASSKMTPQPSRMTPPPSRMFLPTSKMNPPSSLIKNPSKITPPSSMFQAPLRYAQPNENDSAITNTSFNKSDDNIKVEDYLKEINLKEQDIVDGRTEDFQELESNKKLTNEQENNERNECTEEVHAGKNIVENKLSSKLDELRIYLDDEALREIESMNSSRSSELDDGYSSLHKLDNLSPTLGEDSLKSNSTSGDTNIININKTIDKEPIKHPMFLDLDLGDEVVGEDDKIMEESYDDVVRNLDKDCYGYADPEDSIPRLAKGMEESDYEIPVDCNIDYDVDSPDVISNTQHPYYSCSDKANSALQAAPDPFTKAFENTSNVEKTAAATTIIATSPFKRIHPKVIVPPPPLNSICNNGELAPVPSEYSRTPSSDGDEMLLSKFYSGDLRRRAREQAKKIWSKNSHPQALEEVIGCSDDAKIRERLENDIFYSSKDIEKKMDLPTKYATRTSVLRSLDTPLVVDNDATYRLQSNSLEQEKKKKSKIKKFFKKLSANKKDGKLDYDHRLVNERLSSDGCTHNQRRRSSEGASSLSCHSNQNIHAVHSPSSATPPFSKRRMFTFNLSFMKKGRRARTETDADAHSVFTDDGVCETQGVVSNTVRALCSPDLNRRSDYILVRHDRRGSDPSLYRMQRPSSPSKKKYRAPEPPKCRSYSDTHQMVQRLVSKDSAFSSEDAADYANYPFSKVNLKAPMKPQRLTKGSYSERCSLNGSNVFDSNCNHECRNNYSAMISSSNEPISSDQRRSDSHSSDSSVLSSDSITLCQKQQSSYDSSVNPRGPGCSPRVSGALRRTPLRHSVDSYNKLLEVHKQTIEKIAFEIASLRCDCESLRDMEWDDFERAEEMIQLGLNSYMVSPVSCKSSEKRRFYAWLRLAQQHANTNQPPEYSQSADYPTFDLSKSTLHRNCIHACHIIEQSYSAPFQDGIPKSIQIDCVYISTQCPKMTLNKYISLTLEKHARYPEIYEREAAMMLLQVVKGIQNLHTNNAPVTSIDSENVFILNNGEPSVVLSPRRVPNRCPSVAVSVLPGLGDRFQNTETDAVTSICHKLAFLLFELMHSPYQDELSDAIDMSMLLATLPDLTIKSIYSRYLQYVINLLLGTSSHTRKSLEDLQIILEIILFGPSDISEHSEEETIILINKWHNRRCVDMVTHILKEAPLIMLCASGPSAQDVEKIKNVDQEILLECEFLSYISSADIYRVSKMLNR